MPGKRRRHDASPGDEPDWIDASEDFEPLRDEGLRAPPARRRNIPPVSRDPEGEADWVDPPEAFGPASVEEIAARPEDAATAATAAAGDEAESDRVDGPAERGAQPKPAEEAAPHPRMTESRHSTIAAATAKAGSGPAQNEIRARFAEAFLAELDSDPGSRGGGVAPNQAAAAEPAGAGDASFEEQLRRVFRRAAGRD